MKGLSSRSFWDRELEKLFSSTAKNHSCLTPAPEHSTLKAGDANPPPVMPSQHFLSHSLKSKPVVLSFPSLDRRFWLRRPLTNKVQVLNPF